MIGRHPNSPSPRNRLAPWTISLAATLAPTVAQAPVGWADLRCVDPVMHQALAYDAARQCVVTFGGAQSSIFGWGSSQATWEWNGAAWHQRTPATAPPPSARHAMAYDSARHRTVFFGGAQGIAETWEWDGSGWVQQVTSPQPTVLHPAIGLSMAYDAARARTVLFDGSHAETWEWNGSTWTQRTASPQPPVGFWFDTMVYDAGRSRTVLFSGDNSTTWEWDGTTWAQIPTAGTPPLGKLVYDVGQGVTTLAAGDGALWDFDGVAWTQRTAVGGTFGVRAFQEFAVTYDLARAEIVRIDTPPAAIASGDDGRLLMTSITSAWNGSSWIERHRSDRSAATGAEAPPLAYDPVHGGVTALTTVYFGTSPIMEDLFATRLEIWNGRGWTDRGFVNFPLAEAATAFDTFRGVLVSLGGRDPGCFGQGCGPIAGVGEWNGTAWTFAFPAVSPPARTSHAMAFDETRNETVLFGGATNSGFQADTWTWNGAAWTNRSQPTSPPARAGHGIAFDPLRQRTLLFGGSNGAVGFADTWEWDGVQWQQRSLVNNPPPGNTALCWHPTWQRCVAYAGTGLWTFDGNDWTAQSTAQPLPASNGRSIAYDPNRDALLVAGGGVTRLIGSGVVQAAVTTIGNGCAGTAMAPVLTAPPSAIGDLGFELALDDARPGAPCAIVLALQQQSIAIGGGCTVYLDGTLFPMFFVTSTHGHAEASLQLPFVPALQGLSVFGQSVVVDPLVGALGLALSNALELTIGA